MILANKGSLSTSHWIVKSNKLNEIRNSKMTITQIRFFSIYLSKINPQDTNSREVLFRLNDYTKIMQFKQTNTTRMMQSAEDLLGLTVAFRDKDGGFTMCQIFKRFKLFKDTDDEWYVSINCHDDIVSLIFELRGYYFKYQLWNALQLTSPNQQRMYELLKQYEYAGAREISVKDLREFLGLKKDEYPRWDNFKVRVLESAQQALENYTDIKFTWEVVGKRGKGGKIDKLKFHIERNEDFKKQLLLEEYLSQQEKTKFSEEPNSFERQAKEITVKTENPAPPQPIELGFITETLSQKELSAIWQAANGNVTLIQNRYHVAKQQREIKNLVGFMIWAVQQPDTEFRKTTKKGKTAFHNYDERTIDCDALQRKENNYNFKMLEKLKQTLAEQQETSEVGV